MTFDRREHQEAIEKRHEAKRADLMPAVRLVQGAAPVMEKVLRSDDWGRYQSMIQGLVKNWSAQLELARAKLADPSIWATDQLLKLKSDVIACEATIAALTVCLELPAAIIRGAAEADALVAGLEKKDEAA